MVSAGLDGEHKLGSAAYRPPQRYGSQGEVPGRKVGLRRLADGRGSGPLRQRSRGPLQRRTWAGARWVKRGSDGVWGVAGGYGRSHRAQGNWVESYTSIHAPVYPHIRASHIHASLHPCIHQLLHPSIQTEDGQTLISCYVSCRASYIRLDQSRINISMSTTCCKA